MEYQQRLARKRQEVAHLQKQKENLLEMQEKILTMQEQYLVSQLLGYSALISVGQLHAMHVCTVYMFVVDVQDSLSEFRAVCTCIMYGSPQGPIEDDEPGPSESPPVGEEGFPQHLAQELEKQKELYDEIMAKTKRLKNLRVVSQST